jgi:hypothetical protein
LRSTASRRGTSVTRDDRQPEGLVEELVGEDFVLVDNRAPPGETRYYNPPVVIRTRHRLIDQSGQPNWRGSSPPGQTSFRPQPETGRGHYPQKDHGSPAPSLGDSRIQRWVPPLERREIERGEERQDSRGW